MNAVDQAILKLQSGKTAQFELEAINPKLAAVVAETGSDATAVLEALMQQQVFLERLSNEIALAVLGAKQTRNLILVLPLLSIFIAGRNPATLLLTKPIGWILLLASGSLIWLALRTSNQKILFASKPEADPGFELELVAVAVRAGMPFKLAYGFTSEPYQFHSIRELRREISRRRNQLEQQKRQALAKLPNQLILINGLLVLPATLLLAFAPLALSGISQILNR
ncbi:MAG: hypothetical protein ACKOWE_05430 [Micrococcales bacterium]